LWRGTESTLTCTKGGSGRSGAGVAVDAAGKVLRRQPAAKTHRGFALWSKREPTWKSVAWTARNRRLPVDVAQPGAVETTAAASCPGNASLQSRRPPRRAHISLLPAPASVHGEISLFFAQSAVEAGSRRQGRRHRDARHTNAVPCAAEPNPIRVMTTVNDWAPRRVNRRRSESGSTSTPRTRISSTPQSSAAKA
jgi:hypothetical protein